MALIILVGTSHKYQIWSNAVSGLESNQFEQLLLSLCREHNAKSIAEEMSHAALIARGVSETIAKAVSKELEISHQLSEPSPELRQSLGVRDENDIRSIGWLQGWNTARIEAEVRSSHEIREQYWLSQLQLLNSWPLVFICGANHLNPFAALLRNNGYEVVVAATDWEPSQQ